jgi:hypothetical protein
MDLARPQTLIDKGLGIDPAVQKKKLSWLKSGSKYLFYLFYIDLPIKILFLAILYRSIHCALYSESDSLQQKE